MPNRPAERLVASRASKMLRHDSARKLDLTQLTHPYPGEERPQTELKMPFWHATASNDCVMIHCVN
jgi:hypothetical protein